jgi:hypothetical protein
MKIFLCLLLAVVVLTYAILFVSSVEAPVPQQDQPLLAARRSSSRPPAGRVEVLPTTVSAIDGQKNQISTGTPLIVKGTLFSRNWSRDDECYGLMSGKTRPIQHGEVNPRSYCRFSLLLSERDEKGNDLWPVSALVCDMTPEELGRVLNLYQIGAEVEVHGVYAPSLHFDAAPLPGRRFGVPVLLDCSVFPERSSE